MPKAATVKASAEKCGGKLFGFAGELLAVAIAVRVGALPAADTGDVATAAFLVAVRPAGPALVDCGTGVAGSAIASVDVDDARGLGVTGASPCCACVLPVARFAACAAPVRADAEWAGDGEAESVEPESAEAIP